MSNYRKELIQVAASCLAAAQVEDVDTTALDGMTLEGCAGQYSLGRLLDEVRAERWRQELKWGTRDNSSAPPRFWFDVIAEEFGEVAEEVVRRLGTRDTLLTHAVWIGGAARARLEKC